MPSSSGGRFSSRTRRSSVAGAILTWRAVRYDLRSPSEFHAAELEQNVELRWADLRVVLQAVASVGRNRSRYLHLYGRHAEHVV